jgi:hypothetical protein
MALMAEGLDVHIPKGYIYFSVAFALLVDIIQLQVAKKSAPVKVHEHYAKRSACQSWALIIPRSPGRPTGVCVPRNPSAGWAIRCA